MSQDSLNDLKNTLQDAFDEVFDSLPTDLNGIKEILSSANDLISSRTSQINSNLSELLKYYGINPSKTSIDAAYSTGIKSVPRKLTAQTNEDGSEIIVSKKYGLITPLEKGDGVIPHDLTERLYALASSSLSVVPNIETFTYDIPDLDFESRFQPNIIQNYDSLINIEGSADAATVEDLKALSNYFLKKSYEYMSKRIFDGYIRAGGKRKV